MKKLLTLLTALLVSMPAFTCDVCQKQQPKILRGVAHGAGPESDLDYLIVAVMTAIVIYSLYFAVVKLIKPAEEASTHIKHSILSDEL